MLYLDVQINLKMFRILGRVIGFGVCYLIFLGFVSLSPLFVSDPGFVPRRRGGFKGDGCHTA
jgi:hypothetical protein